MAKLEKVEGIGDIYANTLRAAGVSTTDALLQQAASPAGRKEIAKKSGISGKLILEWVNHVDLFRITGISEAQRESLKALGAVEVLPKETGKILQNLQRGPVNAE